MAGSKAGTFDKLVRIERPVADASFDGAGSGQWALVDEVWANLRDLLPSRGERLANGIGAATRPARVRIRARDDVTPDMRFVHGMRVMPIVSGPAKLDADDAIEFMVETYRPAGNAA
jgi:head-tail adaptor